MQENSACKAPVICRAKPKLFATQEYFSKRILWIMRLTAILLLTTVLHVSAKGFGQEKITISVNNAPLEQVLNSIKKQTGYYFVYRQEYVSNVKVSIHVNDASLKEALEQCLKNLNLSFAPVGLPLRKIYSVDFPAESGVIRASVRRIST